ncbi:L antigen family member 3 [Heterocephalus glaber]|uniref:L antigen family member 3 n=1 Tax=Heterocephalus glaber TaxID=10181 RepID=G5BFL2_HETGA|nr:L antigen family member 3 [Heterocephalus glaber]
MLTGCAGTAAAAAGSAHPAAGAPKAPGVGLNPAPKASGPESRTHIFRWTAEDASLLQVSVVSFLEQLSLVVRTMQRFGPPVSH